jgi:hypothetical protein
MISYGGLGEEYKYHFSEIVQDLYADLKGRVGD